MNVFEKRPLAVILAVFLAAVFLFSRVAALYMIIACAAALAAGTVLLILKKRRIFAAVCFAVVFAGLLSLNYYGLYVPSVRKYIGTSAEVTGTVVKITRISDTYSKSVLNITSIGDEKVSIKAMLVYEGKLPFEEFDVISAHMTFSEPEIEEKSGGYASYGDGIYIRAAADCGRITLIGRDNSSFGHFIYSVRSRYSETIGRYLSGSSAAFLRSVTIGDRSGLPGKTKYEFSRIGISHMLAISGLHLSVFCGGMLFLFPRIGVHRSVMTVFCAVFALFFVFVSGGSPSILRAALMFLLSVIAYYARENNDSFTSLMTAVSVIVILFPYSINDVRLQLSFTATLGLVSVFPYTADHIFLPITGKYEKTGHVMTYFLATVIATVAATVFSLPLLWYYFGNISLFAIPANLLLAPLFAAIMFGAPFVAILAPVPQAAEAFGYVYGRSIELFLSLVSKLASVPGILVSLRYPFVIYLIILLFIALGVMAYKKLKSPLWSFAAFGGFACAFAVCLAVFNTVNAGAVDIYAAGRGTDDMLIISENGKTMICDISDGSPVPAEMSLYVAESEAFDFDVDHYMLTHYHKSSAAVFEMIADVSFIRSIVLPEPESPETRALYDEISGYADKNGINVTTYKRGCGVAFEDVTVTCEELKYIEGFSHPSIAVTVTSHGRPVKYFSPNYLDAEICEIDAYAVILGQHGARRNFVSRIITNAERIIQTGDKVKYIYENASPEILDSSKGFAYTKIRITE